MKRAILFSMGDGTCWPIPGEEMDNLSNRFRYAPEAGGVAASDAMLAASIIDAYGFLVRQTVADRKLRVAAIRGEMRRRRDT